jgi:phosphoglycolate phosphatase/pyrophosphatase PpaX
MPRRFDVVLFDLDGTIADTLPLIYQAFDAAVRPVLGRSFSDLEIRQMFGPPDHEIIRRLVPAGVAEEAFARFLDVYTREHGRLVTLFEGMADVLRRAKTAGMRVGIITGKSRQTALITLGALGVMESFDVLYGGDDIERPKPDPQALLAALVDLKHQPGERVAMVGDSAADILAGRAAGAETIAVRWGSPDYDEVDALGPDVVVTTSAELTEALGV